MKIWGLVLWCFSIASWACAASSPMRFVQENVNRVLSVLEDPHIQGDRAKTARMEKLSAITDGFFDPIELSRRALGQYWRMLSPEEQQEFSVLFLQLIKQTYLDKFDAYNNQGVRYEQEVFQSPTQATVLLTASTDKGPLHIQVNLIQTPNGWKAFDIVLENISLVRNYRTQFQSILQSNAPHNLIAILKEKVHGSTP
jgi:phospholipid transport system substrate-binding protein